MIKKISCLQENLIIPTSVIKYRAQAAQQNHVQEALSSDEQQHDI